MTRPASHRHLLFLAWMAVGAGYSFALLGAMTIGPLVLPIPVVGTVVLLRRRQHFPGALGLVSGLGLPLLYVAWLNRAGPGNICTTYRTGQSCVDQFNPWPWLSAGILLVVGGAVAFELLDRRSARVGRHPAPFRK